jgi:hypothetical protein
LKDQLLNCIENLLKDYENEDKCGIFFKLEKDKDPMDIIGVLDFLKYKIVNWGNSNIFSYLGDLFNNNTVLVIGSDNAGEAKSIIKFVYLSQLVKNKDKPNDSIHKYTTCTAFENYLDNEIDNKIKQGYPINPDLETKLKNHLKTLLSSRSSENLN